MGHPKKQRKMLQRPKKPYDKERIVSEKKIVNEFGLRRKRELWSAASMLRDYRRRSRALLANPDEKKQKELFDKLNKLGFNVTKLDDVLTLKLNNLLSRRLQTVVFKKGYAKTLKEARQLIVHRHVLVEDKKVWYPGYLVTSEKESTIDVDSKIKDRILSRETKAVKAEKVPKQEDAAVSE